MTDPTLLPALAQFGAAGLIGWMWLTERRAAAHRERQLDEAHRRIESDRQALGALVRLVEESARALTGLERQQRELSSAIERLNRTLSRTDTRRQGSAA